jgi:5-methyltetrahydrofolate--homocysteine methyltransferase
MVNIKKTIISKEQKDRIENWWNFGSQERPLIFCSCRDPKNAPLPKIKDLEKFWNNPRAIVEREIQKQNQTLWFGEAVPYHYPEFGAAAMAIMLGAGKQYIGTESIWAVEQFEKLDQLSDISLGANSVFYDLVWETMKESLQFSDGHHILGVYCLGSPVDTLAGLMGTEKALISLISDPYTAKQVLDKIFNFQISEFEKYIDLLRTNGFDYSTNWYGLWCKGRAAAIQEDCSCMISKETYEEFCLPYVKATVERMDHSFYHLDGFDAVRHLPVISQIPDLKVIQWTPGINNEDLTLSLDVIRSILLSKKSCYLYARAEEIPMLVREFGPQGLCINVTDGSYETCCRLADEYKLEVF